MRGHSACRCWSHGMTTAAMSFAFVRMVLVCASANTATGKAESIERRWEGVQSAGSPSQLMRYWTFPDNASTAPASRPSSWMQVKHEPRTAERLLESKHMASSPQGGVEQTGSVGRQHNISKLEHARSDGRETRAELLPRELQAGSSSLGDVIFSASKSNASSSRRSKAPEREAAEFQKEEAKLRKQREKLQEAPGRTDGSWDLSGLAM